MYKVVVSSLFIDGKKHIRGDLLDITDEQAIPHGTRVEFVAEPPKPKRAPRKKKVIESED